MRRMQKTNETPATRLARGGCPSYPDLLSRSDQFVVGQRDGGVRRRRV